MVEFSYRDGRIEIPFAAGLPLYFDGDSVGLSDGRYFPDRDSVRRGRNHRTEGRYHWERHLRDMQAQADMTGTETDVDGLIGYRTEIR
jgi:hypothetical protein